MFDWVYEILYSITKTLFKLIDGLVSCANMLCGIEPITVDGQKTDFMTYILTSDPIMFAFKIAALLGIIVVVVFAVIAIVRTIAKEKSEGTPVQVVGKVVKNLLLFLFIPTIMIVCIWAGNIFMNAVYQATTQGTGGLGNFLFVSFAQESNMEPAMVQKFLDGTYSYKNTSDVQAAMELSDFEFVFSWIAGGIILVAIGKSMILFVDRVISITILYIVSPFSVASATLDEGARFKLWREQLLIKFITGYGMIIAINIFALICNLVMNPGLVFFEKGSFLDFLMKLLIIGGGALTMSKSMALIGNLVSSGAGSNELRDNAIAGGLGGLINKVPGVGMVKAIGQSMKQEASGSIAQGILPSWLQRSYGNRRGGGAGGGAGGGEGGPGDEGSGSKNDLLNLTSSPSGGGAKDSINGNTKAESGGNSGGTNGSGNANHNNLNDGKGNQMLNNALNNDSSKNDNQKRYDDFYE